MRADSLILGMARLAVAFPHAGVAAEFVDLVRDHLGHASDAVWLAAVEHVIATEKFYPAIATLNDAVRRVSMNENLATPAIGERRWLQSADLTTGSVVEWDGQQWSEMKELGR